MNKNKCENDRYAPYRPIIADYAVQIGAVTLDGENWVYLNYKTKMVEYGSNRDIYNSRPATIDEYLMFITNVLSKNKTSCTFKELKKYIDFHGVKKEKEYVLVMRCDSYYFSNLLKYKLTLHELLTYMESEIKRLKNELRINQTNIDSLDGVCYALAKKILNVILDAKL